MRAVPQMKVEIDGAIITRPGAVAIIQCDLAGKPTIARVLPQLQQGETLVKRLGCIPMIAKETPCQP